MDIPIITWTHFPHAAEGADAGYTVILTELRRAYRSCQVQYEDSNFSKLQPSYNVKIVSMWSLALALAKTSSKLASNGHAELYAGEIL